MNEFAVEKLFNKTFILHDDKSDANSALSPPAKLTLGPEKPQDEFLAHLKERLNGAKCKLNQLELDNWHQHTRTANPAGRILWHVQNACKPELLTQAWLKFYQMVETFDLVRGGEKAFCSLHLCEAPGAFVTALNHHLKNNSNTSQWSWTATSLNPHYEGNPGTEMVSDDRFLLKTHGHWDFGPDATGDLLQARVGAHLGSQGPFDLVTADGSIDCQEEPGRQEETVAALLAAETLTALAALKPGGHFLLKTFTWFENSSVSLLHLLCSCFGKVSAVKPVASKEGNSEVYLVCQTFRGVDAGTKSHLWEAYGREIVLDKIPADFVKVVREASLYFLDLQVEAIEKNLASYESGPSKAQKCRVRSLQNSVANRFLDKFNLSGPIALLVAPDADYPRLQPPSCPWTFEQMQAVRSSLRTLDKSGARATLQTMVADLEFQCPDLPVEMGQMATQGVCLGYGRPFAQVTCSKFCAPWLLQLVRFCRHLDLVPQGPKVTVRLLHSKLSCLKRGEDFSLSGFSLLSCLDVGILRLVGQQFRKTVLTDISGQGCTFEFSHFGGMSADFETTAAAPFLKDGLQLLQIFPLSALLGGEVHPLVWQANEQTVLRLAQATLAALPELIIL